MASPSNFNQYSTVQNTYDRVIGSRPSSAISGPSNYDPIQYSQPARTMRSPNGRGWSNASGNEEETPYDRINRDSLRQAEQAAARLQAGGDLLRLTEPQRIQAANQYRLTPYEQNNFNRLRMAGYSDGYSFNNAGSGAAASYRPNSIEGRTIQGAFDRDQRDDRIRQTLMGYTPSNALEDSYNRLFNRLT